MKRSTGLALLLAISLMLAACGWERQKQIVVRTVAAAVFEKFVAVQRCATLTQGSVKSVTPQPARVIAPPVRTADPVDRSRALCRESKRPRLDGRFAEADLTRAHRRPTCTG